VSTNFFGALRMRAEEEQGKEQGRQSTPSQPGKGSINSPCVGPGGTKQLYSRCDVPSARLVFSQGLQARISESAMNGGEQGRHQEQARRQGHDRVAAATRGPAPTAVSRRSRQARA